MALILQNNFFERVGKSGLVGEVPKYLQAILINLGFSTVGSFRAINEKEEINNLIIKINEKLKFLCGANTNNKLRVIVENDLENYYEELNPTFLLPLGHEKLIVSIWNYCKNITETLDHQQTLDQQKDSSEISELETTVSSDVTKTFTTFKRLAESYIVERKIPKEFMKRELKVFYFNDAWYISCCFCDIDVKMLMNKTTCIGTNFKQHLEHHHRDLKTDTSNSSSTSPALSPINIEHVITSSSATNTQTNVTTLVQAPILTTKESTSTTNTSSYAPPSKVVVVKENITELTSFLNMCINNAIKNQPSNTGNRFDQDFMKICIYKFLRGGRNLYEFDVLNLNFPSVKTIRRHADKLHDKLIEGHLYFDELKLFLNKSDYPMCVALGEDGTKIKEVVEYDYDNDILLGLVSPFDEKTGMVKERFYSAATIEDIKNNIKTAKVASYVYIILAQPVFRGAPYFVLGFYASDNKFSSEDVLRRYRYIHAQLSKRGIELLSFSTDGDTRYLKAQKDLVRFGEIKILYNYPFAGNCFSAFFGYQDPTHIQNRMRARLFDTSEEIKIGKYSAVLGHLYVLFKKYPKNMHGLNLSDLNPLDRLNYKCLPKITSDTTLDLLANIPHTNGTIIFLKLIKAISIAYVSPDTSTKERIENAFYITHFLRLWQEDLKQKRISKKHFITYNAYCGLELNLIYLVSLIQQRKLPFIFMLSSQINESFFRLLRSLTGMESIIVNSTVKGFISRLHNMQLEEIIMMDLGDKISFPKLLKRHQQDILIQEELTNEIIMKMIEKGVARAIDDAKKTGIDCEYTPNLAEFLRVSQLSEDFDFEENFFDINDQEVDSEKMLEDADFNRTVTYEENGKTISISKASFVLQLQSDIKRLKTDISDRFITSKSVVIRKKQPLKNIWIEAFVSRGDIIVIEHESLYLLGMVISFQKSKETDKSKRHYIHDFVDLKSSNSNDIYYLLDPVFKINKLELTKQLNVSSYFSTSSYICHLENENICLKNIFSFIDSMDASMSE
ncbi:hypothetical protein PVAND_012417 [Polypedilum vanderplanki]|uniref:Uncharacterized protein n=1 Tax=Polypedilum vanderplanki TaxID=319348 RepID=A0A9J6CMF3_POLVA|nr:hypothetical protein PVAND_012417 [Polypedilum vanderplanki]